ncbi:uncharacterized protein LOC142348115, partial [Convolutriloba macropyga]|uniref:uncharacterized protein LOC142348115 n=1 Tax=Convolutriloba macropyga TaxID=536237 RepID=UPI003F5274BB
IKIDAKYHHVSGISGISSGKSSGFLGITIPTSLGSILASTSEGGLSSTSSTHSFRLVSQTAIGDTICILDGLAFVLATMISKKYSTISPMEFLFVRCILHLMAVSYVKFRSRNFSIFSKGNSKPLMATVLTGFLGVVFNLAYLYSLKYIPPADMFAFHKLKIIVTGVTSMIVFGEIFGSLELLCASVVLTGEIVLAQPPLIFGGNLSVYSGATFVNWLIVLSSVLSSGFQPVLLRYALARGTKEFKSDASDYLLHFGLFGLTILNMMGTASTLYNKTSSDYAIMCVYSLLAMSGSALFKISLDYISSARYAVINCAVVPLAFFMDSIAGTGAFRLSGLLGACIVTFGVVLFSIVQYYRQQGKIKGVWYVTWRPHHQKFMKSDYS